MTFIVIPYFFFFQLLGHHRDLNVRTHSFPTRRSSDLGKRLLADNAIAKRDYEEKRNASREASANLQAAKAMLESAELDLEHTRIVAPFPGRVSRSEEHTSELQSLMRISYAVFCLKKKTKIRI